MTVTHECPICRARADRIAYLEERLERAEQALEADIMHPPYEWALNRQQEVVARCLARGCATVDSLLAALEHAYPSEDGRTRNHITVLVSHMKSKISDFGWIVQPAQTHSGLYRIHPDQFAAFQSAMRGEGSHAYPAMTSRGRAA